MKAILFIYAVFFTLGSVWAQEPAPEMSTFEVMVIADRVNLRNAGSLDSDVIGQVNYGDLLTGLELRGDWVRVRAPESLAVWVHGRLLFEDREVRARVLNMRSGPGTQFELLGQLERMDPVTVLEQYDEWRRIEASDAVQVWIFRELVQVTQPPETEFVPDEEDIPLETDTETEHVEGVHAETEPVEEPVEEPVAEPVEEPVEETVGEPAREVVAESVEEPAEAVEEPAEAVEEPAEAVILETLAESSEEAVEEPAEAVVLETLAESSEEAVEASSEEALEKPEDVQLVPLEGQGMPAIRRGWVKAYLIAGTAPSRFQLVYRENGREEALAYLRGDEEVIRSLVGRQVLVRGRDFWVAGQRVPLMRIESIEPTGDRRP